MSVPLPSGTAVSRAGLDSVTAPLPRSPGRRRHGGHGSSTCAEKANKAGADGERVICTRCFIRSPTLWSGVSSQWEGQRRNAIRITCEALARKCQRISGPHGRRDGFFQRPGCSPWPLPLSALRPSYKSYLDAYAPRPSIWPTQAKSG